MALSEPSRIEIPLKLKLAKKEGGFGKLLVSESNCALRERPNRVGEHQKPQISRGS